MTKWILFQECKCICQIPKTSGAYVTQGLFLMPCVQWMSACVWVCEGAGGMHCSTQSQHHTILFCHLNTKQGKKTARVKSWLLKASTQKWHVTPTPISLAKANHLAKCNFSVFHFTFSISYLYYLGRVFRGYNMHPYYSLPWINSITSYTVWECYHI